MDTIGLYIDADNVSYKIGKKLLSKVSSQGHINIKKIYGDWSKPELKSWHQLIIKLGLEPMQCFRHNKKQSSDIHLITDLINDLHYYSYLTKIVLVSSDSDFSHLCHCIKKMGKKLLIVGHKKSILKNLADQYWYAYDLYDKSELKQTKKIIDYDSIVSDKQFKDQRSYKNVICQKSSKKRKRGQIISFCNKKINDICEQDYLVIFTKIIKGCLVIRSTILVKKINIKLKPYKIKLSWANIEEYLEKYSEYFAIYKKNKNKIYIIYIKDLINYNEDEYDNNIIKIKKEYYSIFQIISSDDLKDLLFNYLEI